LKKIKKYKIFVLLIFVFSLPLHQKLSTILLIIGVLASIAVLIHEKINFSKIPRPYYLIVSLFFLNVVYIFIGGNIEIKEIEQRLSLFVLPLFLLGFQDTILKHFNKIVKAFILGTFISVVLCFSYAFFVKKLNYFLLIFFSLTIFLVSNRISILALLVVFSLYILYFFIKDRMRLVFSTLSLSVISMIVLLSQPRYIAFFEKFETIGLSYENNDRFDYVSRLMVWESSIELISKNYIFGVGPTNAQDELNKIYKVKNYQHPLSQNLNAHNQYLQSIIEGGVIGIILLLFLLYYFFKVKNINKYNFLKINIGVLLIIQMLFEVFLNRYSGIVIFSFLFCLFNSEIIFLNDIKDKHR